MNAIERTTKGLQIADFIPRLSSTVKSISYANHCFNMQYKDGSYTVIKWDDEKSVMDITKEVLNAAS